jgi:hypothetical protein
LCPKLAFFLLRHHRLDRGPAVWARIASSQRRRFA